MTRTFLTLIFLLLILIGVEEEIDAVYLLSIVGCIVILIEWINEINNDKKRQRKIKESEMNHFKSFNGM